MGPMANFHPVHHEAEGQDQPHREQGRGMVVIGEKTEGRNTRLWRVTSFRNQMIPHQEGQDAIADDGQGEDEHQPWFRLSGISSCQKAQDHQADHEMTHHR